MTRYIAGAVFILLSACATMVKPDMTPESKQQDRYDCVKETNDSNAKGWMSQNSMYRDCMKARGYQ